jgi:hypothetical protein
LNGDFGQFLKTFQKKPLSAGASSLTPCKYNTEDIKKIIPHREPFLLVDSITGIDLNGEFICGVRYCPENAKL